MAGTGSSAKSDGIGTAASFFHPFGVTVDTSGTIYVSDSGNNMIRKIVSTGNIYLSSLLPRDEVKDIFFQERYCLWLGPAKSFPLMVWVLPPRSVDRLELQYILRVAL